MGMLFRLVRSLGRKHAQPMHLQTLVPVPVAGHGDSNEGAPRLQQLPVLSCTPVTDYGARTTSENRSHQLPFPRQMRVSHGVDTAIDAMQPTRLNPPLDFPTTQTESQQLPDRDEAVLPSR